MKDVLGTLFIVDCYGLNDSIARYYNWVWDKNIWTYIKVAKLILLTR